MAGIEDLVAITITEPPPSEAAAGYTQVIRGTATFTDKFAAPPFVYASIQKKDWYKPEILEKTWHERGVPIPPNGNFEIEWIPDTKGHFEVTIVATPAPLSLPVVGVFPITGRSDMYKVEVGEAPPEEERIKDFVIVSYSKNGGPPVTPPDVLELDVGDRCRLNVSFGHTGAATSGKFHAAIGNLHHFPFDWIDEVLAAEKVFTTPTTATDEWETFEDHIDILITSGIDAGDYSLYVKIMGITGTDVFTEFLENVITVTGVPIEPEFRNLAITAYDSPVAIGDTCRVHVQFEYQGPSVSKELYAAIGNYGFWGFDEILHGAFTISVPETKTWQGYEADVDIYVSTAIDPAGSPYDLYAKINGVIPDVISPTLENVITVTGVAPPPLEIPDIVNQDALDITEHSVRLIGVVEPIDPRWIQTTAYFQWGKTSEYGNETPKQSLRTSSYEQLFYCYIMGLEANTIYHYRAVVDYKSSTQEATRYGSDMLFRTLTEPTPAEKWFRITPRVLPEGSTHWQAYVLDSGWKFIKTDLLPVHKETVEVYGQIYEIIVGDTWEYTPLYDQPLPAGVVQMVFVAKRKIAEGHYEVVKIMQEPVMLDWGKSYWFFFNSGLFVPEGWSPGIPAPPPTF